MNMTLRVVIPARYESTRLPGKPLVDLCGIPMIVRVYQRVVFALPHIECLVAIDDVRIANVLERYNVPFVLTSKQHNSGTDRINEVCEKSLWNSSDIVINVQGDEPLFSVEMLRAFESLLNNCNDLQVATIACPITSEEELFNQNVVKVVTDINDNAIYFSRFAIPFVRDKYDENISGACHYGHVGIYAYTVAALRAISNNPVVFIEDCEKLEQLRVLYIGLKIKVLNWKIRPPHGVDTAEDVNRVVKELKDGCYDD